jgi:hypothetical protein
VAEQHDKRGEAAQAVEGGQAIGAHRPG